MLGLGNAKESTSRAEMSPAQVESELSSARGYILTTCSKEILSQCDDEWGCFKSYSHVDNRYLVSNTYISLSNDLVALVGTYKCISLCT